MTENVRALRVPGDTVTEQARLLQRFLSKVTICRDGCWLWTANKSRGYGLLARKSGQSGWKAHRLSFEIFVGPIPDGHDVLHECDTPACVNPQHLKSGTAQENMRDAARRGRLNPRSLGNLRPGAPGFHGAGPTPRRDRCQD